MRRIKLAFLVLATIAGLSLAAKKPPSVPITRWSPKAEEAPVGYDDRTNGYVTQQEFNEAMGAFNRHYFERDGLGPVFNAETCLRCHQFPTIGGFSLNTVTRVGRYD